MMVALSVLCRCSAAGCWLLASDQFVEWIEQPYASDADLLRALCKARVSLSGSC